MLQQASVHNPVALQRAIADPSQATPADILALQRTAGNRAVTQLIQTKLTVGPVGDKYEQEADRVADQVLRMPEPGGRGAVERWSGGDTLQRQGEEEEEELQMQPEEEEELQMKPLAASITPLVQRQGEEDEELQMKPLAATITPVVQRQDDLEDEELQMKPLVQRQPEEEEELQAKPLLQRQEEDDELQLKSAIPTDGSFEAGNDLESRLASRRGGGYELPKPTQDYMEPRFGADFSNVRVHTDSAAVQLNREIGAQAFTHGSDVFFGAGKYDPGTEGGKRLLAHELTHVVQQGGGQPDKVQGKPAGGVVQREIIQDWKSESKLKWYQGRSKALKKVDTAVAALAELMPGAYQQIVDACEIVLTTLDDWRATKKTTSKREDKAKELETAVKRRKQEKEDKLEEKRQAKANYQAFQELEPDLAKYAKRTAFSGPAGQSSFTPDKMRGPGIKTALTMARGESGKLTPEAIEMMNKAQEEEITKEESTEGRNIDTGSMTVEQLREFMEANKHKTTGKTMYPELKNITDPLDAIAHPDNVVTTPVVMSGVTMQVKHNQSDVNFAERLKLLSDAVAKIDAKGINVPPLKVHMPKYGRGIRMKATEDTSGQLSCEIENKSSRAVFIPPGFMHLSSEIIGTPDLTEVTNPVTKEKEYKFSSTGFDTSGVATIVHEFGHVLHYAHAPGKFHGLWGTGFKDAESSKVAQTQVSQYGRVPREFVAEVFLGLMYDKDYSDDVLKMYKAFGGFIPPAMTARFQNL